MKVKKTSIPGTLVIEPTIYEDNRGFFQEIYNDRRYRDFIGQEVKFVQDNHSRSKKNILRGLHFQIEKPQGKLVRVTKGRVLDVVVDIRTDSASFGKWGSLLLSDENNIQFWIPPGLAHGFLVLSEYADFEYKCTSYYDPEDECCLIWNDPNIAIEWPNNNPIVSEKDQNGMDFMNLKKILMSNKN
jgi:dTDP-4-dehydrorhamnose 3,5-epimerase